MREKPRYRIEWAREKGVIVGYFVYAKNAMAVMFHPSFYVNLLKDSSK